jgi:hypothetical protein
VITIADREEYGMNIDDRYAAMQQEFDDLGELTEGQLASSRVLFEENIITPQKFEVWTCLAGMPMPASITQQFQELADAISSVLPKKVRMYKVLPPNYHWELFIVKRPHEIVSEDNLMKAKDVFSTVIPTFQAFEIAYRGFLVTKDGVVIAKGYGAFDQLRDELWSKIPYASPAQSNLGHVSLGRILDPLDHEEFSALRDLIYASQDQHYGSLLVQEAQYVYETRWYMEETACIGTFSFQT